MILKSYLIREELFIEYILVNSSEEDWTELKNENNSFYTLNVFHYVNIKKLKKMKFFEFKEWFNDLKQNDNEYLVNLRYYGFRIIFNKNSIDFKDKNVFPIYPWNSKFKKTFILSYKNDIYFKKWLYKNNKFLYRKWINDRRQTI